MNFVFESVETETACMLLSGPLVNLFRDAISHNGELELVDVKVEGRTYRAWHDHETNNLVIQDQHGNTLVTQCIGEQGPAPWQA